MNHKKELLRGLPVWVVFIPTDTLRAESFLSVYLRPDES